MSTGPTPALRCGVVLGVTEHACQVRTAGVDERVAFAAVFPSPRVERVSPGNLVAVARTAGGADLVVWRWYDAVVLGEDDDGGIRLWESFHGEVVARPRPTWDAPAAGSRAWASAGLPGADWWVCAGVGSGPHDDAVDLAQVRDLYAQHDMWTSLG